MMKHSIAVAVLGMLALAACAPQPTSNDKQREQEAQITNEGASEVGMPNITHFREMRLLKTIYEMRDQGDLSTWTYLFNQFTGKYVPMCPSIGFPIPYATQFSAPESMQTYNVRGANDGDRYGVARLPQAEPNGLNMPTSAEGTWIICIGPNNKPAVTYSEPRVVTFLYKLPESMVQH